MSSQHGVLTFRIAETAIRTKGCGVFLRPGKGYHAFAVASPNGAEPDVNLRVHVAEPADLTAYQPLFDSNGSWALSVSKSGYAFTISPPALRHNPKCILLLTRDFRDGDIVFPLSQEACDPNRAPARPTVVEPLAHPFDELLAVGYLAFGKGTILHACGIVDSGKGILFCGVSGAGKSTMARIWMNTDVTILSDDRIIVRRMDGCFRIYGTPWHGDANVCDPGNAPLEKLFFIVHADHNYAKPISPIDAASRLLVRCFPPFWDKDGMEFVTNFLAEVAEEVPCYELGFVPDQSVVDFVRNMP